MTRGAPGIPVVFADVDVRFLADPFPELLDPPATTPTSRTSRTPAPRAGGVFLCVGGGERER
jgi:hypothetical protein